MLKAFSVYEAERAGLETILNLPNNRFKNGGTNIRSSQHGKCGFYTARLLMAN
jgi:hypothetical protein